MTDFNKVNDYIFVEMKARQPKAKPEATKPVNPVKSPSLDCNIEKTIIFSFEEIGVISTGSAGKYIFTDTKGKKFDLVFFEFKNVIVGRQSTGQYAIDPKNPNNTTIPTSEPADKNGKRFGYYFIDKSTVYYRVLAGTYLTGCAIIEAPAVDVKNNTITMKAKCDPAPSVVNINLT